MKKNSLTSRWKRRPNWYKEIRSKLLDTLIPDDWKFNIVVSVALKDLPEDMSFQEASVHDLLETFIRNRS